MTAEQFPADQHSARELVDDRPEPPQPPAVAPLEAATAASAGSSPRADAAPQFSVIPLHCDVVGSGELGARTDEVPSGTAASPYAVAAAEPELSSLSLLVDLPVAAVGNSPKPSGDDTCGAVNVESAEVAVASIHASSGTSPEVAATSPRPRSVDRGEIDAVDVAAQPPYVIASSVVAVDLPITSATRDENRSRDKNRSTPEQPLQVATSSPTLNEPPAEKAPFAPASMASSAPPVVGVPDSPECIALRGALAESAIRELVNELTVSMGTCDLTPEDNSTPAPAGTTAPPCVDEGGNPFSASPSSSVDTPDVDAASPRGRVGPETSPPSAWRPSGTVRLADCHLPGWSRRKLLLRERLKTAQLVLPPDPAAFGTIFAAPCPGGRGRELLDEILREPVVPGTVASTEPLEGAHRSPGASLFDSASSCFVGSETPGHPATPRRALVESVNARRPESILMVSVPVGQTDPVRLQLATTPVIDPFVATTGVVPPLASLTELPARSPVETAPRSPAPQRREQSFHSRQGAGRRAASVGYPEAALVTRPAAAAAKAPSRFVAVGELHESPSEPIAFAVPNPRLVSAAGGHI